MSSVEKMSLSVEQSKIMAMAERVSSALSVAGITFIFLTYMFSSSFNKPINRLVFYGSIGCLGMNVASLIGQSGMDNGADSSLCQFQGFLVQM